MNGPGHWDAGVADRENSRLQFFSLDGKFLEQWTHVNRPMQVRCDRAGRLFVAEVGFRAGLFPWQQPPIADPPGACVTVFDPHGTPLARWGGGPDPCAAGDFYAPHDLCLDSRGDLYVGEVAWSAGGRDGHVAASCHTLQKFIRVD